MNVHPDDYAIAQGPPPIAIALGITSMRVGSNDNNPPGGRNAVFIFPLPALAEDEQMVSAELTFQIVGRAGDPAFNVDLWGIGFQPVTSPLTEYFAGDTGDPTNTKLEDDLITPEIPADITLTTTNGRALGAYLKTFYDAHPDYTGGHYVFLRLTPDATPPPGSVGWSVGTAESANRASLRIITQNPALPWTNFLIMITDDQRWDGLGVVQREQGPQGRFPWYADQTPNMDRLAAEGIRFRNAFVTYPLCSPSRAAILSGRYNHHNGIIDNKTPFPDNAASFATELRKAGYVTAWMGKWHMDSQRTRPGFDEFARSSGSTSTTGSSRTSTASR